MWHSANLQSTIGLSSGESEFYGLVKGAAVALGLQAILADWGLPVSADVASDSSAARGHVQRRGLGRMRHIQTRYLWIQERVGEGHIRVLCVAGKENDADMMTKALNGKEISRILGRLGFELRAKSVRQKSVLS